MFLALLVSTAAAAAVLLWAYWLNRNERSLLWMAACFAVVATASPLLGHRASFPSWLSIEIGVAVLLFGSGLTWVAVRVFNGQRVILRVPLIGPVLWLIACQVPAFRDDPTLRVIAASTAAALYYFAAARAVAIRDGIVTRLAVAAALSVHGVLVLSRIPFILANTPSGEVSFSGQWFGFATLESAVFVQIIAFLLVSMTKERVEVRLRDAALTDELTGLGNRRAFFEASLSVFAQNARKGRPTTVIVFDLDRFKEVNDRFGHPAGDAVIRAFAQVAIGRLRAGDVVGRLGGEEFAVTLPETTGVQAHLVAGQLSQAFADAVVALGLPGLRCSTSAGIAETPRTADSVEAVLTLADKALYEAKAQGGGKVCVSPVRLPEPADQAA